jgi:hypothetical protein
MGIFSRACYFFLAAMLLCAGLSPLSAADEDGAEQTAGDAELLNVGPIPEAVRRPQRGEAPRYPRDAVIGELGRGQAPEAAYRLARNCLAAAVSGRRDSDYWADFDPPRREEFFSGVDLVSPRSYRLGGGREEPDGSVSFLFRFLGREQSVAGEFYLRQEEGTWYPEDVILEEPREITTSSTYPFDFSPYERFF